VVKKTAILWLRNDFRLKDNKALIEASKYDQLIPIFIWDENLCTEWKVDGASKWWLHETLLKFKESLQEKGSDLILFKGSTVDEIEKLVKTTSCDVVLWNRSYNPKESKTVKQLIKKLTNLDVRYESFEGSLLKNPKSLTKSDGTPYLVYTPFWNNFLKQNQEKILSSPTVLPPLPKNYEHHNTSVENLKILGKNSWYKKFHEFWTPGEKEALRKVSDFLKHKVGQYQSLRDLPHKDGTSCLSPHLHFGEIHPQRILSLVEKNHGPIAKIKDPSIIQFCKEILWREFSYHLLQFFPHTTDLSLKEKFSSFPWRKNKTYFLAWTKGQTGYPIVDAGMRQLWQTGWMHNRVRMISASFLIKHLNVPWQEGAKWFWQTLLDADLASNTQGWQWTAGCGADAAPFFRIFNPITQGQKFDPEGNYARLWCPELSKLPSRWIYSPWLAPSEVLIKAGIKLGENYPKAIVDHKTAREKALENYKSM